MTVQTLRRPRHPSARRQKQQPLVVKDSQFVRPCTACRYFGGLRVVLSCCKTEIGYAVTAEAAGSSPVVPAIQKSCTSSAENQRRRKRTLEQFSRPGFSPESLWQEKRGVRFRRLFYAWKSETRHGRISRVNCFVAARVFVRSPDDCIRLRRAVNPQPTP